MPDRQPATHYKLRRRLEGGRFSGQIAAHSWQSVAVGLVRPAGGEEALNLRHEAGGVARLDHNLIESSRAGFGELPIVREPGGSNERDVGRRWRRAELARRVAPGEARELQ